MTRRTWMICLTALIALTGCDDKADTANPVDYGYSGSFSTEVAGTPVFTSALSFDG